MWQSRPVGVIAKQSSVGVLPADLRDAEWRLTAVCRGTKDPELFFPKGNRTVGQKRQTREALAMCGRCPVRTMCLRWAVVTGQDTGVWGGMTEDERRHLTDFERRAITG